MSTQIRIVCSCPQSDKDWLPFYYPSQSQSRCCEASDGHHARQPEAKPFCLLPQLHELCGLLCEQQAQPNRTSKAPLPSFLKHQMPTARALLCLSVLSVLPIACCGSPPRQSWKWSSSKDMGFEIRFIFFSGTFIHNSFNVCQFLRNLCNYYLFCEIT